MDLILKENGEKDIYSEHCSLVSASDAMSHIAETSNRITKAFLSTTTKSTLNVSCAKPPGQNGS